MRYNKTTSEKALQVGGWILIAVGAFLIFYLAAGVFTAMLFAIPIVIGIVMVSLSGRRVKQLKKQQRDSSRREEEVDT